MQETKDGKFGETKPYSEFMKLFEDEAEMANTKAIHFGTPEELEEIRKRKPFEERLSALEDEAEKRKGNESEYIVLPTPEEIKKYAAKGPMERNMLKIMRGISSK